MSNNYWVFRCTVLVSQMTWNEKYRYLSVTHAGLSILELKILDITSHTQTKIFFLNPKLYLGVCSDAKRTEITYYSRFFAVGYDKRLGKTICFHP